MVQEFRRRLHRRTLCIRGTLPLLLRKSVAGMYDLEQGDATICSSPLPVPDTFPSHVLGLALHEI